MAATESFPQCASAQIYSEFPRYHLETGHINEDTQVKLRIIATIWTLLCEVEENISPNISSIHQSSQITPCKSKKSNYFPGSNQAHKSSNSTSNDVLLRIKSTYDHGNYYKRCNSVATQFSPYFSTDCLHSLPIFKLINNKETPILSCSNSAISIDFQSTDGQYSMGNKKKTKNNNKNQHQKVKRNGDKNGQSKKYEEKDGSDEEDDNNNNLGRNNDKNQDGDGNKENRDGKKGDEKDETEKNDEEEDEEEEEEEKKNKKEERKESKDKFNSKNKKKENSRTKEKSEDKSSVDSNSHAYDDLNTSGYYPESSALKIKITEGRDLGSSDDKIACNKNEEEKLISPEKNSSEVSKTASSVLPNSIDKVDKRGNELVIDEPQGYISIENSNPKTKNILHTEELGEDIDSLEKLSLTPTNRGHREEEEKEEDISHLTSNADSFDAVDKKEENQETKIPEVSKSLELEELLENKKLTEDVEPMLSLTYQDLDPIQIPGTFNSGFSDDGKFSLLDKIDKKPSDLILVSNDCVVDKNCIADNLTVSNEIQTDKLAQEISCSPLNSSGDTENFLSQAILNVSPYRKNNRLERGDKKNKKNQKSFCTGIIQEKDDEQNINNILTENLDEILNFGRKDPEETSLSKFNKLDSASKIDQGIPEVAIKISDLEGVKESLNIDFQDSAPNNQSKTAKSNKEKKREQASLEAEMKKSKARASHQDKIDSKKYIETDDSLTTKSDLKVEENLELKVEEESQYKKTRENKVKAKPKPTGSPILCVDEKMKEVEAALISNSKKGHEKRVAKKKEENFSTKEDGNVVADNFRGEQQYTPENKSENVVEDIDMNILNQPADFNVFNASNVQSEANLNKIKLGEEDIILFKQDRFPQENCAQRNLISPHNHDEPAAESKKFIKSEEFSKLKTKANKTENKKPKGNVASKLESFEALQNHVTSRSSSKVSTLEESQALPLDDFLKSEISHLNSIKSEDVPGSVPLETVAKNLDLEKNLRKKAKKDLYPKKNINQKITVNEKIKIRSKDKELERIKMIKNEERDIEEDPIEIKKVQGNKYNESEINLSLVDSEALSELKDQKEPEEIGKPGESEELEQLKESEQILQSEDIEKLGEAVELVQLEEPGEILLLEDGGELQESSEHQFNEITLIENSALILSEVHKTTQFNLLKPENKTTKKQRSRVNRDGYSWGILGVASRRDVKKIAKRKSGDVKKVRVQQRTKHSTAVKSLAKKDPVGVSPKRADKAVRPPISRGISSIFAPPTRSKSISERRISVTRKPSSRRQTASEATVISPSFTGLENKPEIPLKVTKLLGISPSPGAIPVKKVKANSLKDEDIGFISNKEGFTSPEKNNQNIKIKNDDIMIDDSGGPSEPTMRRSESTRRTGFGGILSGLISTRSRPTAKRRNTGAEEDHRNPRRQERKIKQSSREICEVKMSGGLIDEDSRRQRSVRQNKEEEVKKDFHKNVAVVDNTQKARRLRRVERKSAEEAAERKAAKEAAERKAAEEAAERKAAEEAAERKAAELAHKARKARRAERRAAEQKFERKVTEEAADKILSEKEAAELAQKARRARRAARKAAEEGAERKVTELSQKHRTSQGVDRAERKSNAANTKRNIDKIDISNKTVAERASIENTQRVSDEERREWYRRKEVQQNERKIAEKEAKRAARRLQISKEKEEQKEVERRNSRKHCSSQEGEATGNCLKAEIYWVKANNRNPVSQIPEFEVEPTQRKKEQYSPLDISRNSKSSHRKLESPNGYQTPEKSEVRHEFNKRSSRQGLNPWPDSVKDARKKVNLRDPTFPISPLVSTCVEPLAATEQIKPRESRKSNSFKQKDISDERDERRKRDSRRIQETFTFTQENQGHERRSSHRSSTFVDHRVPSVHGSLLSRWKKLVGV
ncbi:hypothetical protein EV44_g4395 [Erysiphe necator]|uniref:Uncharacterized protein n=1 Tax=Uncinula necator TaxID=52586 RepID=A0A0B1PCW1_UNCNE|nr:hypothetical protein EV44_g4395 [Erysiphe necator]